MWRIALKLAVSGALIAWLVLRIPLSDVITQLKSLDAVSLATGAVLSLAAWWLSALRLHCLAPEMRLADVVRMTFIGLYYGTVLPGQVAGDLMKAYRLSPAQSTPGRAVAATLVDRVVATFALFLIGACAAPWVPQAPNALKWGLAFAAIGILAGILLLAHPRIRALLLRRSDSQEVNGIRGLPARLASGLQSIMQRPSRLVKSFQIALVFHALCVAIHLVLAHALRIDLPIAVWALVYAGIAVLLLLPISIAGLGLREGGYVGLLGLFGIGADRALSLSFVFFAYTLLGAVLGWIAELTHRPVPPRS